MAKRKYEFDENTWDDEREYKKVSKKKVKHRQEESNNWRYNPNMDYSTDDYDNEEEDYRYGEAGGR